VWLIFCVLLPLIFGSADCVRMLVGLLAGALLLRICPPLSEQTELKIALRAEKDGKKVL
jgi:hypothetical protein